MKPINALVYWGFYKSFLLKFDESIKKAPDRFDFNNFGKVFYAFFKSIRSGIMKRLLTFLRIFAPLKNKFHSNG